MFRIHRNYILKGIKGVILSFQKLMVGGGLLGTLGDLGFNNN
jgi:hypothetical protein